MQDFIYGFHSVSAFVRQSADSVINVFVDKSKKDGRTQKLIQLLDSHSVSYQLVLRDELTNRVGDVVHQGVVAHIKTTSKAHKNNLNAALDDLGSSETLLILDGVVDPTNLGACLRVADAAGVRTLILPKDKSASVTAVTRKVAAGAAESVNIITVTNLVRTIDTLKQHNFWIYGLADETSESIYMQSFKGRIAIIMGNEAKGLRQLTRQACDHLLAIPMSGQVTSLNVATATAVTLFEINRQRSAQQ